MTEKRINEIADSWVNGNKGWVRSKVKNMNKYDFFLLVRSIEKQLGNDNTGQLVWNLLGK